MEWERGRRRKWEHVFKAEDFQKAFDTLADRNSGAGKVVLTFT